MLWNVTTPPTGTVIDPSTIPYHLRTDADLAATGQEQAYIAELLAAATEYAEVQMQTSLLTRTITAVYYQHDAEVDASYGYQWQGPAVILRRGPVQSLVSVTNGDGANITGNCTLQTEGTTDILMVPNGWVQPLTVVYTAGYGTGYTATPPDIRQAIRAHVGHLYENRESSQDKALIPVPHSLEAFYGRKCRTAVAG